MRIFKAKRFNQWASSKNVTDESLVQLIQEVAAGLVDVNLGGGLCKKRLATSVRGKRGGYRTLLAFRSNSRTIFYMLLKKMI